MPKSGFTVISLVALNYGNTLASGKKLLVKEKFCFVYAESLRFEQMELLFRHTNTFNPEFTVNCLKSRDS